MNPRHSRSSTGTKETAVTNRRVFLVVTILFPFILFAAIELGLRLLHYGPDLSLFVTETVGGRTYHVMNPGVKSRYFSHVEFSPATSLDFFEVPKPAGTYRIFCLGGSTTVGYPYGYVGSFSTFLRDRLRAVFPNRAIEVINVGMTATNSFTTADICRELFDCQPDLLIVYDGHNEFYGALGVSSRESIGHSRWLIKAYLRLNHLKTFLVLRTLYNWAGGLLKGSGGREPGGTIMERLAVNQEVPYRSGTYMEALDMFSNNLREIRETATSHGVPLIFSSQVSNLRDRLPFVSRDNPGDPAASLAEVALLLRRGIADQSGGRFDSALVALRRAAGMDSLRADLHFEIARCLDTLGLKRAADAEYVKARNFDQLRFRTSSDFNYAILQESDDTSVISVDMERAFRAASPDSLIGSNLILEHLHPNLRGYFLMAKEFAGTMRRNRLLATGEEWNSADTVSDRTLWDHRAVTDLDEMCAGRRTQILTSGWPFRPADTGSPPPDRNNPLSGIVEQMVRGTTTWDQGHIAAAQYYRRTGDLAMVEREYRALINQIPLNVSAFLLLADLCLQEGRRIEARNLLDRSLGVERTFFAMKALGSLELDAGRTDSALTFFRQASALGTTNVEQSEAAYLSAVALARGGNVPGAIAELQTALRLNPSLTLARTMLRQLSGQ